MSRTTASATTIKGKSRKALFNLLQERRREERLVKVSAMYLRRCPQHQIAKELGVSGKTISVDLTLLHDRWLKANADNVERYKAEELARIAEVEKTAWEQWEKSLKIGSKTVRVEQALRPVAKKPSKGSKKGDVKVEQNDEAIEMEMVDVKRYREAKKSGLGDPTFLDVVMDCIRERSRIRGLTKAGDLHLSQTNNTVNLAPSWDDLMDSKTGPDPIETALVPLESLPSVRAPVEVETSGVEKSR